MTTINIPTLDALPGGARQLLEAIGGRRVVAFHAEMGAGKTTIIKAMCEALGVGDTINSPTFAIVNEYRTATGDPVYHFDCYRLKDVGEALDFGFEDYMDSGALCLIEWPDVVAPLLPGDTVDVRIAVSDDGRRTLTVGD